MKKKNDQTECKRWIKEEKKRNGGEGVKEKIKGKM